MKTLTEVCKQCCRVFVYETSGGAKTLYCSDDCRKQRNRSYQREWMKNDRALNPERQNVAAARSRAKNKDAVYARTRVWFANNPGYRERKAKEWREENPAYGTEWRRNNRERVCIASHNRRVIKELAGTFTVSEWNAVVAAQNGLCKFYDLGRCDSGSLTQDHIVPLSRGGKNTIDNIQALCLSCNTRKNHRTNEEFLSGISVPRGARNKKYVRLSR